MPVRTIARFGLMLVVVVPLAAVLSYVFQVLVERRFMTSHRKG